ncbi:hypothetical protein K523DRAFT_318185 [Schizophyllum commune Tattone D]|nr:hypothetical protein K525DRAFT_212319 [Schizophyllum commune Loenen D]KAI5822516.1 hypothetical protein K523DRAFT_318185 [Schizophyllum commune Tattone D]
MLLTDLPPELLEEIFLQCDPCDVGALAQCCSYFHTIIYAQENPSASMPFWRALYLQQPLDDPRLSLTQLGLPRAISDDLWKTRLQRLARAQAVLEGRATVRLDELESILESLLDMIIFVVPLRTHAALDVSSSLILATLLLRRSTLLDEPLPPTASLRTRQLLACIHTHFGLTPADHDPARRVRARAYVYDLRKYRHDTHYGPFLEDDTVDWEMMRELHEVMSMHFSFPEVEAGADTFALYPMCLPYTQLVVEEEEEVSLEGEKEAEGDEKEKEKNDWAGVAGLWQIAFCYCDHRELIHYNSTATTPDGPLDASLFEDPDFVEICRTLQFDLHVSHTEPDPQHLQRPKIHFEATDEDMGITIRGVVSVTPDERIRWRFVCGDPPHPIWSCEAVQVGGVRSKYGILGVWTTIFHDDDGPVGPFWLRRYSEEMSLENREGSLTALHTFSN